MSVKMEPDGTKPCCPACGRRASIEEWDTWLPSGGWRHVRALRCRAMVTGHWKSPCGIVTVQEEQPAIDREPPLP